MPHATSSSCGEVTTATIATTPKHTAPTTFLFINGFALHALASVIHIYSQHQWRVGSVESKVWKVECKVWNVEWKVWTVEWKVWSVECKVWSM